MRFGWRILTEIAESETGKKNGGIDCELSDTLNESLTGTKQTFDDRLCVLTA